MKPNKKTIIGLLATMIFAVTSCAKQGSGFDVNEFRKVHEEIWNTGDFSRLDEFYAADYRVRDTGNTINYDIDATKNHILNARKAFPDLKVTVDDAIQQGDTVAIRKTYSGTHKGPLHLSPTNIIQASGKKIEFSEMAFYKIKNGKLVEGLAVGDTITLLKQIGAMK